MPEQPEPPRAPGRSGSSVRLDVLRVIATGITSGIPLYQTIEIALDLASQKFPGHSIAFSELGPEGKATVVYSREPEGVPSLRGRALPLGAAPNLLATLQGREPATVRDVREIAGLESLADLGSRAALLVPLVHTGRLAAILSLHSSEPWSWTEAEVATSSEIAEYLSLALRDAHTREERERAEKALRQSQEQFRQIADNIREVFWLSHADRRRLLYVSPQYEEIWGRPRESLYGSAASWFAAVHPADRDRVTRAAYTEGTSREHEETYRIVRPDGSIRWVWDRSFPVRDENGKIYRVAGLTEDITKQREAEEALKEQNERLRMAQKMEAVGQLAGGVAHDFNNLLVAILGYSDLALSKLKPDDPIRKDLEEVVAAGERAADLTRQLLAFSRRQVIAPVILDLSKMVEGVEKMLRRIIGEDVELIVAHEPGLGQVRADPTQLEQVIVNLAVNARDAMPRGGKLVLETTNVDLDESFTGVHPGSAPGPQVMLAVSDTGVGMTRETQSRIFEPFFTTKEAGKGTGLGLATVYGIVKQSGWYIAVYSEVGKGTTFKVFMPRADGAPTTVSRGEPAEAAPRGTETVLVAEDDPAVRDLTCSVLRGLEYRVLETHDAEDALAVASAFDGPIHLLLTDIVMPRMYGTELARRLKEARPETACLFMSGYTDRVVEFQGVGPGFPFLQKPFSPRTLARKVREVLDKGRK